MVQYCSECGNEIEETDKFCKNCGRQNEKIESEEDIDQEAIPYTETHQNRFFWAIGIIVVLFLAGFYLLTPETKSLPFSVQYQEPIYKTEYYQEPTYGTLYSGTIGNYGLTGQTWTITDATSYTNTYTGQGLLGEEYTFQICWSSSCSYYYKIQFNNLKYETKIIGIETRTRQVIDRYVTKYRTEWKDITKTKWDWFYYYDIQGN